MTSRLRLFQFAFAAIGVIGIMVSIVGNDIIGIAESGVILFMAVIAGFLDSYIRKKQGTKNKL
ncbi:MAG: hypothetical protein ACREAD_05225 [Nitrosopumilaceae archaeon]